MIVLRDFTVGDAVLAFYTLSALAERAPSDTAKDALRQLANALLHAADQRNEAEGAALDAAIAWARADRAANTAADDLAAALAKERGSRQPELDRSDRSVELLTQALDLAAAQAVSTLRKMRETAAALLIDDPAEIIPPSIGPSPPKNLEN